MLTTRSIFSSSTRVVVAAGPWLAARVASSGRLRLFGALLVGCMLGRVQLLRDGWAVDDAQVLHDKSCTDKS